MVPHHCEAALATGTIKSCCSACACAGQPGISFPILISYTHTVILWKTLRARQTPCPCRTCAATAGRLRHAASAVAAASQAPASACAPTLCTLPQLQSNCNFNDSITLGISANAPGMSLKYQLPSSSDLCCSHPGPTNPAQSSHRPWHAALAARCYPKPYIPAWGTADLAHAARRCPDPCPSAGAAADLGPPDLLPS